MLKQSLFLVLGLFINLNYLNVSHSEVSDISSIYDGPYIFNENGNLRAKWIENGNLREDSIVAGNFDEIKAKFKLLCDYEDLKDIFKLKPTYHQSFSKTDSVAVISDVHGEYNIYIKLLKAAGIIDKDLHWKFGKGHLVVLGDIFDKGDMVTETYWHLFALEKEASEAGGMVHVLIGNHELMILGNDTRYINEKYKKVEEISGIKYSALYSENSVLGKWLRSKPVVITINDILFVHGGISIEMVEGNMSIEKINYIFSEMIVGKNMKEYNGNAMLKFLAGGNGPIWYRGYLTDKSFNESRLDSILKYYSKKHIVVGHTSTEGIKAFFNNKVFGVDAGISIGLPGAILLSKNGVFYQVTSSGERTKF